MKPRPFFNPTTAFGSWTARANDFSNGAAGSYNTIVLFQRSDEGENFYKPPTEACFTKNDAMLLRDWLIQIYPLDTPKEVPNEPEGRARADVDRGGAGAGCNGVLQEGGSD